MNNPNYLKISPEELSRMERIRDAHEKSNQVDEEWCFVASFGKHFGWGGVQAILNNEIDLETANSLMLGAQKVEYTKMYNLAQANFIGTGSVNSKNPGSTFSKLTRDIRKMAKV